MTASQPTRLSLFLSLSPQISQGPSVVLVLSPTIRTSGPMTTPGLKPRKAEKQLEGEDMPDREDGVRFPQRIRRLVADRGARHLEDKFGVLIQGTLAMSLGERLNPVRRV